MGRPAQDRENVVAPEPINDTNPYGPGAIIGDMSNSAAGPAVMTNETLGRASQDICCEKEYREPRQELLKNWEVGIQFHSIGCVIRVGCKSIPFTSVEEGMKELNAYIADPHSARKKWEKVERECNQIY